MDADGKPLETRHSEIRVDVVSESRGDDKTWTTWTIQTRERFLGLRQVPNVFATQEPEFPLNDALHRRK